MAIIALLVGLAVPAVVSMQGAQTLAGAAYRLSDALEQARAYAMGNNTYVYLGICEVSAAQDAGATPQAPGTGRVVVEAVASTDGMLDLTSTGAFDTTKLAGVFKPLIFDNLHLPTPYTPATYSSTTPTTAHPMQRPPADYVVNNLGDSPSTISAVTFGFPLGAATPRFQFGGAGQSSQVSTVITFDPQGSARLITSLAPSSNANEVRPNYFEFDLQQAHGTQVPPPPNANDNPINYVALQCDGLNGSVQVYR